MKGYLANGLFSMGDRILNETLSRYMREEIVGIDLYVPQENGEINNKEDFADSITIAKADSEKLLESDFMIAVLDGVEIDSGVAAEIGLFSSTGRPIYGLFTDVRQQGIQNLGKVNALLQDATENQFVYRNLFVVGLIKQTDGAIFSDPGDMIFEIMRKFK